MTQQKLRIQKYLSQMGVSSRRLAEKLLLDKKIKVNGETIEDLGYKVDPQNDVIVVDGKLVQNKELSTEVVLLNKPERCITARTDPEGRRTVYNLDSLKGREFEVTPVGRLDFLSSGLLLLTNDGELANRLMHPSFMVPRTYQVRISNQLSSEQIKAMTTGIGLPEIGFSKVAEVKTISGPSYLKPKHSSYELTLKEGKNRVIRRIMDFYEKNVYELIRIAYAGVVLPKDLKPGESKKLSASEIANLKELTQITE